MRSWMPGVAKVRESLDILKDNITVMQHVEKFSRLYRLACGETWIVTTPSGVTRLDYECQRSSKKGKLHLAHLYTCTFTQPR